MASIYVARKPEELETQGEDRKNSGRNNQGSEPITEPFFDNLGNVLGRYK